MEIFDLYFLPKPNSFLVRRSGYTGWKSDFGEIPAESNGPESTLIRQMMGDIGYMIASKGYYTDGLEWSSGLYTFPSGTKVTLATDGTITVTRP